MSTGIEIVCSAMDAGATSVFQAIAMAEGAVEQRARRTGDAYKHLNLSVRKLYNETRTPQERHAQRLEAINRLVKSGKIDQDLYNRAVKQNDEALRRATESGKAAFGPQALAMVKSLAAAFGLGTGVAGAVMLARQELEAFRQTQREAGQAALSVAQVEETALINLGAETEAERDAFLARSKRVADTMGVSLKDVYAIASDALSARGEKTVREAMDVVQAGVMYAPGDVQKGKAAAGAALDIGRQTGWSPTQALGLLQVAGKKARVTDPAKLAENLPIALGAALQNQATVQEGAALWSALSLGMTDPSGRQSRTATIALTGQLAKHLPQFQTMRERIGYLQQNPQLVDTFLNLVGSDEKMSEIGSASFQMRAVASIRDILKGGKLAQTYRQFAGEMPGQAAAGEAFARAVAVRRGAPIQQVARAGRAAERAVEELSLDPLDKAGAGVLREKFVPMLQQAGLGAMGSKLQALATDVRGGDMRAFQETVSREAEARRRPREFSGGGGFGANWSPGGWTERPPTPLETRQAEILERLAAVIAETRTALEANTRNVDAQTRAVQEANRRNHPATLNPTGREK